MLVLSLVLALVVTPDASKGRLEPSEAVKHLLEEKRSHIERCYEQHLKRGVSEGEVVISLTLARSGRVLKARVRQSQPEHLKVGECIVGHLRKVRLPKLTQPARVEVPIRLKARG